MKSVIWNYCISRNAWSSLSPPQDIEISSSNYTLAEYQSQLLIIGGHAFQSPRGTGIGWNKCIYYKLDQDAGWEVRRDLQIPEDLTTLPSSMSATSYDRYLIITWVMDNTLMLLIHFNGQGWKIIKGPQCTKEHCKPGVFFLKRMLYLSENGFLHRIALESLHTDHGYSDNKWEKLPEISERSSISNFAVIYYKTDRPMITAVIAMTLYEGLFYAFEPESKKWIRVGVTVKFCTKEPPVVVGLQCCAALNARVLLMGQIKPDYDPLSSTPGPTFGTLEVTATY